MTLALPPQIPCHDATTLTAGGPLARIALDGKLYTLRITARAS